MPTATDQRVRVAPLRVARRRDLAIDLAAHLHHSTGDFGLICLWQIIRTNIEQFRHGIANQDRELITRPDIPRCRRSDNCHFPLYFHWRHLEHRLKRPAPYKAKQDRSNKRPMTKGGARTCQSKPRSRLVVPLISHMPLNLSVWNEARIRAFVQNTHKGGSHVPPRSFQPSAPAS